MVRAILELGLEVTLWKDGDSWLEDGVLDRWKGEGAFLFILRRIDFYVVWLHWLHV